MSRISFLAACLIACVCSWIAAPVRADIQGTYTTTQNVDGGQILYTIDFQENGDVSLTSERRGRPRTDRDNIDDYGRIVRMLDREDKLVHVGRWRERAFKRGSFEIRFEKMRGQNETDEAMQASGQVDGDRLTLSDWRRGLYGDRTRFVFERKRSRRNQDGLIAGAAVIALGALIANDRSSVSFTQLDYRSGGSGEYRVDGNRVRIREMSFELRQGGSAKIGVTLGGDGFNLEGRWSRMSGNRIRINVEKAFDSERMGGGGTLYLRNSREVERIELDYQGRRDNRRFQINFTTNRG